MKRTGIKNLVLMIALIQALSVHHAKASNSKDHLFYFIDRHGNLDVVDDKGIIDNNGKTYVEEGDTISIYDERNLSSRQYGANQATYLLLEDPYVWNMMQRVFPVDMYISKEFANGVYQAIFHEISDKGCGYIAFANAVFQLFEGNPDEFEEIFGYPMYVIREDKSIYFNYEYFYLGHFLYNITSNYDSNKIKELAHAFDKKVAQSILEKHMKSDEYKKSKSVDLDELKRLRREGKITDEELMTTISQYQNTDYKEELRNIIANSRSYIANFGLSEDNELGHIKDYLESFGLSVNINIQNLSTRPTNYQPGDIIVFEGLTLYKYDDITGERYSEMRFGTQNKKNIDNKVVAHSVNIVEVSNERVIISNLGDRYILDEDQSVPLMRIRLNILLKEKTNTR